MKLRKLFHLYVVKTLIMTPYDTKLFTCKLKDLITYINIPGVTDQLYYKKTLSVRKVLILNVLRYILSVIIEDRYVKKKKEIRRIVLFR